MKLNIRKTLSVVLSTIILTTAAAESSFAGFAGASLDIQPVDDAVEVYMNGIVAGQYALNEALSLKGNFQFGTSDIVSNGPFQETPSTFSINELSATYSIYTTGSIIKISALLGDQNSFGSESFVQQALGIRKFAPALLTPVIAPVSTNMYTSSGFGLSFMDDFGPNALAVNAFYNKDEDDTPQINGNIRYAFEAGSSIFDANMGLIFPVENETRSGEHVFILIRSVILQGGISSVFNINDRFRLFLQAGIDDINFPDFTVPGLDNIHLFLEPRLALSKCDMNISFFSLSNTALNNLMTVTHPLGCSLNIESLPFLMLQHSATAGIDITASSDRSVTISNPETIDVTVVPHLDCSMFSGNFKTSIIVHPLEYGDISEFFKLSFSFKAQF